MAVAVAVAVRTERNLRCYLGAALLAVLLMAPLAIAAESGTLSEAELLYRRMIPRGEAHFARCWHLEHDYYELRRRIAETGVVWRRQELERQWEDIRDRRRETCLMGW